MNESAIRIDTLLHAQLGSIVTQEIVTLAQNGKKHKGTASLAISANRAISIYLQCEQLISENNIKIEKKDVAAFILDALQDKIDNSSQM